MEKENLIARVQVGDGERVVTLTAGRNGTTKDIYKFMMPIPLGGVYGQNIGTFIFRQMFNDEKKNGTKR